jgi:hypothetical protein
VAAGRSSLNFTGGSIANSKRAGIWSAGMAYVNLNGTSLSGNGPAVQSERGLQFGGIRNSFGSMRLHCVKANFNNGPGLTALGGYNDMAPNGKNVFQDNLTVAGTRAQLYVCSTIPDLCNGRNMICAADGDLIQDCNGGWIPADVTGNHWCGSFTGRIPASWINNGNDPSSTTDRCGLPDYLPCLDTPAMAMFNQGWDQENLMQWDAAMASYDSVMKYWPSSKEAKLCPDRILFCEGMSQKDWDTQRNYFLAVADTTTEQDLKFAARASAAWCLVELDSMAQAQTEFEALMNQADSDYKYQKAALTALLAELKDAPWDSINALAPGSRQRLEGQSALDAETNADPELSVYARIEDLLARPHGRPSTSTLPTQYMLYQNYPNPFNPNTEIKFDLPEDVHIKLKIFNTLGQHVTTLADEVRPAGAYRLLWDGKDSHGTTVASGVYIYQLNAGNFTDAKKMALIR